MPKHRFSGSRIVLSCGECNLDKGHLTIEEYRVVLAFRFGYISGINLTFSGEQYEQEQLQRRVGLQLAQHA